MALPPRAFQKYYPKRIQINCVVNPRKRLFRRDVFGVPNRIPGAVSAVDIQPTRYGWTKYIYIMC